MQIVPVLIYSLLSETVNSISYEAMHGATLTVVILSNTDQRILHPGC